MHEPCLAFVHIPKTAGTSFNAWLIDQYAPSNFKIGIWGGVVRTIDELLQLAPQEKAKLRCIHGHMPHGADGVMPNPVQYCTVMRDPVERVISLFRHKERKQQIPRGMSLLDFAGSDEFEVENGMTKRICGRHSLQGGSVVDLNGQRAPGPCQSSEADLALGRIRCGEYLVGIQEDFRRSLLLVANLMGLQAPVGVGVQNHDPSRRPDWSADAIEVIRARNVHDFELYEAGKENLQSRCQARGPEFADQLEALTLIDGIFSAHGAGCTEPSVRPQLLAKVEQLAETGKGPLAVTLVRLMASKFGEPYLSTLRQEECAPFPG